MLSEAKHLDEISLIYAEMLHFVQHDNGFAMPYRSNHATSIIIKRGLSDAAADRQLLYAPRAWS
jgi:hypothetical protein